MKTPIYDFVTEYIASGTSRLHMPGHKGHGPLSIEQRDITEIKGADVLSEGTGIIGESEANAASLFGSGQTLYSTEGSSLPIRAMLFLALLRWRERTGRGAGASAARPFILAARNVHKVFLSACALLDLDVEWVWPDGDGPDSVCACHPSAGSVGEALGRLAGEGRVPAAVWLTSPDYLGEEADIRGIRAAVDSVCGKGAVPLLVDNAHGAYLRFLPESRHPLDLGAYACCDSAHKTFPVLTGGAYLHLSPEAVRETGAEARHAMALFASTSPSYVILQSLDLCNRYLADGYPKKLAEACRRVSGLKDYLSVLGIRSLVSEPLKLVLDAGSAGSGVTGTKLAELMRAYGMEPEFADVNYVVCMFTPENYTVDYLRLVQMFRDLPKLLVHGVRPAPAPEAGPGLKLRPLKRAMSIREAVFSPHETIDVRGSAGRVLGEATVSCPPAVPIAVCGEIITEDLIPVFSAYGIREVSVVRQP